MKETQEVVSQNPNVLPSYRWGRSTMARIVPSEDEEAFGETLAKMGIDRAEEEAKGAEDDN